MLKQRRHGELMATIAVSERGVRSRWSQPSTLTPRPFSDKNPQIWRLELRPRLRVTSDDDDVLSRNSHTAATSQGLLVFAVLSTRALDKLVSLELQALPLVFLRRLLGDFAFLRLRAPHVYLPCPGGLETLHGSTETSGLPDQNFRENGVLDGPLLLRQRRGILESQLPKAIIAQCAHLTHTTIGQ
jgi:hypothetical protein